MTGQAWHGQRWPGRGAGRHVAAAVSAIVLAAVGAALGAAPAVASATLNAGDRPPGFWYGTDSRTVSVPGPAPYKMPVIGGAYGGYIGMIGNWSNREGCGGIRVWSSVNSAQATTNHRTYHKGIGTGGYWFMGGPGVDPRYNGTTSEASAWGARQAAWALANTSYRHLSYPVLFMDIEIPGHAPSYTPAPDNGWNSVYTSPCSGVVKTSVIPARVDRAELNGFAAYLTSHSSFKAGVYSAPDIWARIFGTGSAATLTNTYEWTYESFTSSLAHPPAGWCLTGSASSTCARFFGGVTRASKYALMWQWSGGGGSNNGHGDFNQIDGARTP